MALPLRLNYRFADSHSQTQPQHTQDTLIFATPSKPRLAESVFGPRLSSFHAPTPIQEEPSSGERSIAASFIAETPVHGRFFTQWEHASVSRASFEMKRPETHTVVAETPVANRFADLPISRLNAVPTIHVDEEVIDDDDVESDATYREEEHPEGTEESDDESDDPLANLMVMTDEEVDSQDEQGGVPYEQRQISVPDSPY